MSIDIETKSSVDITKAGSYRYAQSDDFEILLFAYAEDDGPVQIIDLAMGEKIPQSIVSALQDRSVTKHAYNAAFEWWCLNQAGYRTCLDQWECTMIHGLYCGYTAGLGATGAAVGIEEDKRKLTTGKALIRYFCGPCKPTKSNGGRTWNLPVHAPEKWDLFKEYCLQDVVTEREIERHLKSCPVPDSEWKLWRQDVRMNAVGVGVDAEMIEGALRINDVSLAELTQEAAKLTGLDNPNSPTQLIGWVQSRGFDISDMTKQTVSDLLATDIPADVRRVLELRQQMGKTSIKKYITMDVCKGPDNRIRGISQFYGANRTGRWAGRLVQLQNMTKNHIECLDGARDIVKRGDYSGARMVFGDVPDLLSQLIRTVFVPSEGRHFVVADFSAIEARVIAWLAGESWVNEVFATTGKIYEATAAQMFDVPVELIKKGNPEYALRQKGKVATLALGYQGGPNALVTMGALRMGIAEDELQDIVDRWRKANSNIVKFWWNVGDAANKAMVTGQKVVLPIAGGAGSMGFELVSDLVYGHQYLTIQLPTGRKLFYPTPTIEMNRFDRPAIHYWTTGQVSRKWEQTSTYGGKMVENIVQAVARDCLAETLKRIEARGLQSVFHVHDEVIVDAPMSVTVDEICDLMAEPISWAPGLILKGAGFEGAYYMKD